MNLLGLLGLELSGTKTLRFIKRLPPSSAKWWFSLRMISGFRAWESGPRDRALSAPRHCVDAYKSDRAKGVTRPHRAPVARNGILGPEKPQIRNVQIRNLAMLDTICDLVAFPS